VKTDFSSAKKRDLVEKESQFGGGAIGLLNRCGGGAEPTGFKPLSRTRAAEGCGKKVWHFCLVYSMFRFSVGV
jgi:hypothetical protein